MATIRHVRTLDLDTPREKDQTYRVEVYLEPMQFAIIDLQATKHRVARRLVVAKANQIGGVCNDCTDFDQEDIVRAEIYEVTP